ncbi:MAG: 3-deoxy-7-phosphoheptulonate synthase [Gemmatimonadetes bacterium]|nr:3-deoxy-7-phosphoheptulonate synthase [Gemmatimonadota bacterium]NIR77873.1 3-deoxy-7-phosphoheptulonate synthase [Gemmatimonadota bacterium]NIT86418.1 3-deoxy-7-phosphoheptulonate synthase [Gemmatimonadota bacterium]NIU30255.1 3-deoxy-7-phosphoheptulonate synthase [Gemmatimonadota bacterium]NIU35161.1 3-deoxy-7-phosphoheptulonate synthase [Gemmatimonadota bacterium]
MIIVTRKGVTDAEIDHIREKVEALGLRTHLSRGEYRTVIGCVGDEEKLDRLPLLSIPGVEEVHPVMKPYKLAAREFAAADTRIPLGSGELGGEEVFVVAGPCSVEGMEMLERTARAVRDAGARALRGGAYKPRTSPYSFHGLAEEGLRILSEVRERTGLPVVTEVMDTRQVDAVAAHADVLQIGARNMQNYNLLTEVGRLHRPVLLKRGMSATLREFLLAAEYVMKQGNTDVILCERGIRTFETMTRNTLDVSAIPVLKRESHLPVVADPSHAGGRSDLVAPLAYAAIAAGADGLIVEVHPEPEEALSDGEQSVTFGEFQETMEGLATFARAAGRTLAGPALATAEPAAD